MELPLPGKAIHCIASPASRPTTPASLKFRATERDVATCRLYRKLDKQMRSERGDGHESFTYTHPISATRIVSVLCLVCFAVPAWHPGALLLRSYSPIHHPSHYT